MPNIEQFAPSLVGKPVQPVHGVNVDIAPGPYHPSPQYTFNLVKNGDHHTVRDAQTWLKSRGYTIGVDGIFGPQTSAALKAYLHHIKPGAFNSAHAAANRLVNGPPKGGTKSGVRRINIAQARGGGKGGHSARGGRGNGGGANPSAGSAIPPGVFDPRAEAQALANAEYNPAISTLKGLMNFVGVQDKYNQKQIAGWYTQMQNLMNQQNAEQGSATTAAVNDVTNALGNNAQLFGGTNAGALAPAAGNAAGLLQTEGKSQQDYLSNMIPLLNAQAASGTKAEQNAAAAQLANYSNQLTTQQQAKGQAYDQAYQQALSDQATQEQNQLALAQAQALLPYQISSAQSQARADKVNARYAGKLNQAKLNASNAQVAHYNALVKQEMASAKKSIVQAQQAAKGKSGPAVLAPGSTTYNRVVTNLSHSMLNAQGKVVIQDPRRAQAALFQSARSQGLIDAQGREKVPGALRVLTATLQTLYQRDPGWQAKYRWNGKTFVPK